MELIQEKNSRAGVIGTILFHLLLLLLFIQFGMPYQDPPPENEGAMMINFGDAGGGSPSEEATDPSEEAASSTNNSETTETTNSSSQENVQTTTNETVEMNASNNTNTSSEQTVSSDLNEALNALNNANSNNSENSSNSNSNNSNSNSNGSNNSNGENSGPSNGIGFELGGRGKVSFKKPENPTQEDGTVVVDIIVDKYGKVIKAIPGARGSSTTNPILYQKAKEAALLAKFTQKLDAPADQKGTMTFIFILN
jgi:periplasmic protein TonB